jgi:hypothetical protein
MPPKKKKNEKGAGRKRTTAGVLNQLKSIRDQNLDKALQSKIELRDQKICLDNIEKAIDIIYKIQDKENLEGLIKDAVILVAGFSEKDLETDVPDDDEEEKDNGKEKDK